MKRWAAVGLVLGFLGMSGWMMFGPVSSKDEPGIFIVPEKQAGWDAAKELADQGFIRSQTGDWIVYGGKPIESGGYRLNKNMNLWQITAKLAGKPDLAWVRWSACIRQEQVGEILAEKLEWNAVKLESWNKLDGEGQYYPDTYLVPRDETVEVTAQRFVDRFNEKMAPLLDKFLAENMLWTTGVKIASLIAREAAGPEDAKIISGVIWNRLDQGIRLQIDATMQYTRGKVDGRWWGNIDLAEKTKDSPYNTYLYKGLPPTAICSPAIEYIRAALEPAETECLFYLHDHDGQIHCAKTFEEHKENIQTYLSR